MPYETSNHQSDRGNGMNHDELLAKIDMAYGLISYAETSDKELEALNLKEYFDALRAVVELIQKKQKFLENTKGDIPMTNQQLGAREERTKLLAEIKQAIEKEMV